MVRKRLLSKCLTERDVYSSLLRFLAVKSGLDRCCTQHFMALECIVAKDALPENVIQCLLEQAKGTGLFEPAGKRDLKCLITRKLTDDEIESVLAWCASVEKAIREYGLK